MVDLSILVLLLFMCCFLLYSQFKNGGFSKMNYYDKYRSMIGYLLFPIVIIILLVTIFNKLIANS
ncbi:hypothetical protein SAMN04488130_105148 [Flavobacterium urumqiense]|uniref:Uncharacterized protein n=1 Tax=Flavobacterium urumqiense TaxID=935224 RepID=A0A1H5X1J3_9FLAO|nr:hypothetical protein SAMN04488130_105148 [Flavobacterium urumqiense]